MKHVRGNAQSAITLVETLLAVSLSGLMCALLFQFFHIAQVQWADARGRREIAREALGVMHLLKNELTCLIRVGSGVDPLRLEFVEEGEMANSQRLAFYHDKDSKLHPEVGKSSGVVSVYFLGWEKDGQHEVPVLYRQFFSSEEVFESRIAAQDDQHERDWLESLVRLGDVQKKEPVAFYLVQWSLTAYAVSGSHQQSETFNSMIENATWPVEVGDASFSRSRIPEGLEIELVLVDPHRERIFPDKVTWLRWMENPPPHAIRHTLRLSW